MYFSVADMIDETPIFEAIAEIDGTEMIDRVDNEKIQEVLGQIVEHHENSARYHAQLLRAVKIWGVQRIGAAQRDIQIAMRRKDYSAITEEQKIIWAFLGIDPQAPVKEG
jgi:hypothetical protein